MKQHLEIKILVTGSDGITKEVIISLKELKDLLGEAE